MKLHTASLAVLVALVTATGCGVFGGQFEEDVDCSDSCNDDQVMCGDQPGTNFDYNSYEADCDTDDRTDELCALGDSGDCVEPDFEIEETTVADIHTALEDGEITCQWLTQRYLDRIVWHDLFMEDGMAPLNAFVHLNEAAVETAKMLDDYHQCEGELAGPLHCVPFGIKTNYASDEIPVTHGSLALLDPQPTFDAFTVERLRNAGAITLGSTTMDEFAAGAQGLSGRSGKTGNPYNTDHSSGGSSAGSGVAVASNLAVGALGTDNCSSLTIPASYNNLYTMRSSHQLISTQGIFPTNRLDAVAGPLTRTVEDMALFFDEMATFNPDYGAHCRQGIEHDADYTEALNEDGLQGKRIGILEFVGNEDDSRAPFGPAGAELRAHYDDFFDELILEGAQLVEDIEIRDLDINRRGSGSGYDANRFLEQTEGGVSDYEELCDTELFSQAVFDDKDACNNRGDQTANQLESSLESGLEQYRDNRSHVESILDEHNLDAIVYPADRRGPPREARTSTMCVLSSITGLPTVVIPTGFANNGLPIGMSFTARMFDDSMLIEMAYAHEQATDHRAPPQLPELEGEPPIGIQDFEDVHYDMGYTAFDEVLRDNDKYDLEAEVFADIAEQVLRDWGLEDAYIGE